jgi:hypothetical protein
MHALKCLVATMCVLPALAQEPAVLKPKIALDSMFAPIPVQRQVLAATCLAALCYDRGHGTTFAPSRELMPAINGMRAEGISLKRDRITFRYTFR